MKAADKTKTSVLLARMGVVCHSIVTPSVFLFLATTAHGLKPNECISLENIPKGGIAFKNNCNLVINLHYCVENDRSFYKCKQGTIGGGAVDIRPTSQHGIPEYGSSGGGQVRYAACFLPEHVRDWNPFLSTSGRCR